ncbi:MAG: type II secretion system F family protein [Candidatus Eisenbacteria bacterium]|uniref:Type II secretion system F family protein n=1 Tax=Eiseniibacteriota bacterium TaxID=2212470 RepID=A0A538UE47_UNCEI|nr:MAG: type II secretion system F family protein [Candidatus Eisenbacteria bacterium]
MIAAFTLFLFAAVALVAYVVTSVAAGETSPMAARLRRLRAGGPGSQPARRLEPLPRLAALAAWLAGFLPNRDTGDALRAGLIRAGYRRPRDVMVFLGAKVLLALLLPVLSSALWIVNGRPVINGMLLAVVSGIVGFYLPTWFVGQRKRRRCDEITCGLPDALDLMVVCVEAGLGISAALQRVSAEIEIASPALGDELTVVHQEMQAGVSRTEALRNLAQRTGVEEVYGLVAMLVQTDRLGTGIAQALRIHADGMRTRRRQRAEEMARKAGVKLAFPLVLMVFPVLLVVILAPAALMLAHALLAPQ